MEMQMSVFLVRVRANRAAVGIYSCDREDLEILIDEICDPSACEFKTLPPGGFIFGGNVDMQSSASDPDSDCGAELSDCGLTEGWSIACSEDTGWESIDCVWLPACT